MRVQFLLIFLLLFNSCSESKKIEVFEVDLLENIEKYIPIQKVNNYTINNEYCGKNKKYSCLNIYNSSNIFNNKNFDLVFISYDNSNKKVQAIAQLKTIKSGEFKCAESREEIINQFKSYNKINLNDKNITMIIIAHRRSALEIADKIYRFENSVLTDVTHEIKNTR